ncbi:MAG: hypothetical protein WA004_08250 [Saprospiraceae bacterium]
MKRFPISLPLLLFSSFLFSQNTPEKWVHGYLDFGYERQIWLDIPNQVVKSRNEWSFPGFALGLFESRKTGMYREISLARLQFKVEDHEDLVLDLEEPIGGERVTRIRGGLLLETGFMPARWLGGFFRPGIGIGASPEIGYFRYSPKTSVNFPYREWSARLGLNLIPRLHFRLSQRLALTAVVPLQFGSAEWSIEEVENPALPKPQHTTNRLSFDLGLAFTQARLGLALKI